MKCGVGIAQRIVLTGATHARRTAQIVVRTCTILAPHGVVIASGMHTTAKIATNTMLMVAIVVLKNQSE